MKIDKVSKTGKIGFNDEFHKYFFVDEERRHLPFKSVTQFTKSLELPFDVDFHSTNKARELNTTKEAIQDKWEKHRIKAAEDGTFVHNTLEHLALNGMPVTLNRWHPKLNGAFKFYEDFLNNKKYKLYSCEEILYHIDEDNGVYYAGQRDLALEEVATGRIISIDYKTSEVIRYESFYNSVLKGKEYLKGSFDFLEACNYNSYTVQLNLYKYMDAINNPKSKEKVDAGLYDMYICQITENGYSMIKVDDIDLNYCKKTCEFISDKPKNQKEESIKRFFLG